jgi:hypothetical protein
LGGERVSHLRLRLVVVVGALLALAGSANAFAAGNLVVSQVYGGGDAGVDVVLLHHRCDIDALREAAAVLLSGLSVPLLNLKA